MIDRLKRYAELFLPTSLDPLDQRDPEFIRSELAILGPLIDAWFDPDVLGLEHVPDGKSLVVGTHNGGIMAPDMFALMVAFWRHFGVERASYGLAHDVVFRVPFAGRYLGRVGAVPARRDSAARLLARNATVLVYPGGDLDAFKPYHERHVVKFGERKGFVRTAIAAGAPIVPVISVGAHETFRVLTDGRDLARVLRLKEWTRVEVLPISLTIPWGLTISGFEGHIPAPSKIRIRVLPPIHLPYPPEAASDDDLVAEVREEVRATMQHALDDLVAEGGFGVGVRLAAIGEQL